MDSKLAWIGIIAIIASVLVVLYFVYEQERKKLTTARELKRLDDPRR
jgi:hypothetical protein